MLEIYRDNSRIINLLNSRTIRQEFCICELKNYYINSGDSIQKEDLINLFMGTWIDQTIYWVLVDSDNENCLKEYELYQEYYEEFKFLKFEQHGFGNLIEPIYFLTGISENNLLSEKELLLLTKLKYWDRGVKEFFSSIGRLNIVELAEDEFVKDLSLRYRFTENQEKELKYLWGLRSFN